MTDIADGLLEERQRYCAQSGGGISLPVAGAVYWTLAAVAGVWLVPQQWGLAAAFGSGLIFPLGLALQKPFRSPFMAVKSPLSGLTIAAVIGINLLWPVHVAIVSTAPQIAPLSLAIGMTLHWPIIGWAYASRVCMAHAVVRTGAVTAIWFALPEMRFVAIPAAVAILYIAAALGLAWEARRSASGSARAAVA